jgi:hypothetical protein
MFLLNHFYKIMPRVAAVYNHRQKRCTYTVETANIDPVKLQSRIAEKKKTMWNYDPVVANSSKRRGQSLIRRYAIAK